MPSPRPSPGRRRSVIAAFVAIVTGSLVSSACSVAGTPSALPSGKTASVAEATSGDVDPGTAVPDGGETFIPSEIIEHQPIAFHLWEEAITPDGWLRVPAKCNAPGGEDLIDKGVGWYSIAVPGEWGLSGHGSGGSGSPLNDTIDLRFTSDANRSRTDYIIAVEPDRRNDQGELVTWDNEPSDGSFDYESTRYSNEGEKSYQVTFESVGTVPLGEQQLEVFVAHRAQQPELLDKTVYKVRFQIAQTPMPHLEGGTIANTATLSISHDPDSDTSPLTTQIVQQIAGSIQLPTCTRDLIVVGAEVQWSADLDEDGYISTMDDYLAARTDGPR